MSKVPDLLLESKGIVQAPSTLLRAKGSLNDAVNVNCDAPGVIRSRQGFARQPNGFGGPVWKMVSTKQLGTDLLINFGSATLASGLKRGDGSAGTTTITGTITNTAANRMRCAVGHRNHYLTAADGMSRLETSFNLFRAGMPKGLGLDLNAGIPVLVGAPGVVVPDGSAVAFRTTLCKYDADNNLMEGAPSSRCVVYNNARTTGYAAGVTKNVACVAILPKANGTTATALDTTYFIRIYRSLTVAVGEPPDDMRLIYEAFLTAGDIAAGIAGTTDATPEAFRQLAPALHTNANDFGDDGIGGPGVAQANEPPPVGTDVALFQSCLWTADLTFKQILEFTILSTVAATGITAGDTITIAGQVYTCIAPGVPAARQFAVATVAAGSGISEALARTAQNLVEAINKNALNTLVYAFYVSQPGGLPGKIRLETRDYGSAFTAIASSGALAYRPNLVATSTSTAKTLGGGLMFSKPYLPDAFPPVNVIPVGRDDTKVLALQVLAESLFIFTDDGIYRLTGTSFNDWYLRKFDDFRLLGREMVVSCDGALYAFGRSGMAKVTESGVSYLSTSIEPLVLKVISQSTIDWIAQNGWAVAYVAQHKIVFGFPSGVTDRNAFWNLVFDTRLQAWTRWDFPREASGQQGRSTACVRQVDDVLYLGIWNPSGTDAWVFKEKRTYSAADYSDVDEAGVTQALQKTVKWNVTTAGATVVQNFDEFHLFFDGSDLFGAMGVPTAVSATFSSARNSKAVAMAPVVDLTSRTQVPQSLRTGNRVSAQVTHNVVGEYFGIEGGAVLEDASESSRTGTR